MQEREQLKSFIGMVFIGTFHPPPATPRFQEWRILPVGVQIFSSKKPTKLGPFRNIFQRCPVLTKGTDNDLRVRIFTLLSRGRVRIKKMERPIEHNRT